MCRISPLGNPLIPKVHVACVSLAYPSVSEHACSDTDQLEWTQCTSVVVANMQGTLKHCFYAAALKIAT